MGDVAARVREPEDIRSFLTGSTATLAVDFVVTIRGAENQAFPVERITGIEAVKAVAVEPPMQHRWEELAAYVKAALRSAT